MLQAKFTLYSAHSQNALLNSAVRNELPKLNNKEPAPYDTFHNKLRDCTPLEKQYLDYEKLIYSGLTTETALVKVTLFEKPPTGAVN